MQCRVRATAIFVSKMPFGKQQKMLVQVSAVTKGILQHMVRGVTQLRLGGLEVRGRQMGVQECGDSFTMPLGLVSQWDVALARGQLFT